MPTCSEAQARLREVESQIVRVLGCDPIRDMQDACRVLGISQSSLETRAKSAYRHLARLLHPDKCKASLAKEAFQILNQAMTLVKTRMATADSSMHADGAEEADADNVRGAAQKHREAATREGQREAAKRIVERDLRSFISQQPLLVNLAALAEALSAASRLGVDGELQRQARKSKRVAEAAQLRASCDAAGGADLSQGAACGHAVWTDPENHADEYFTVGVFPCRCGADHFWAMESSGVTGTEPFGQSSDVSPILTLEGRCVFSSDEAGRVAEDRYRGVTGLALMEATDPPLLRPRQWSSVGKLALQMEGYESAGGVMWQFERVKAGDSYAAGWHNYQPDPDSGADSVKIMEQLWHQHRHWASAVAQRGSGAPGSSTGTRLVRSGKFSYSLNFNSGLLADADAQGIQTNSKTCMKRRVRRVSAAEACRCQRCTAPLGRQPMTARGPRARHSSSVPGLFGPPAGGFPPPTQPQGEDLAAKLLELLRSRRCSEVDPSREELVLVERHFCQSLGAPAVEVGEVLRVPNGGTLGACSDQGQQAVMFHGCKSKANEDSIVEFGFRADLCKSGGRNFGTWFAYKSSYSDGGFAFSDEQGWRHLFVCVVCRCKLHLKKDTPVMRVVGEGGAYPKWIVHYRHSRHRC